MNKTDEIHKMLKEVREMAKSHREEATDPQCATLCDTTYQVLAGLEEAFDHYLQGKYPVSE